MSMSIRKVLVLGCLLAVMPFLLGGCAGFPELTGPYLGQEPPGMEPSRFAPDVFKQALHSTTVFSPDGQEVYWGPMDDGRMEFMQLVDGKWTAPSTTPFSETLIADCPAFTADGSRLYFTSFRLPDGSADGSDENIWYMDRTTDGWGDPVMLPEAVNSLGVHWQLSIASNGDLYFGASPAEGGQPDIYRAELVDGEYTKVTRLGPTVNTELMEHSPYVARDGSYLIFTRVDAAFVDSDLYVSFRNPDGSWGEAIRMPAPPNAYGVHDHCPWVSDDGKYLFFNSFRGGEALPYWVDASVIERLRPK